VTLPILAYSLLPALCLAAGFFVGWRLKGAQVRVIERVREEAEIEPEDRKKPLDVVGRRFMS